MFEEVYPARTVDHIMSGKAYARAIRAHTLVESALKTIVLDLVQEKYTLDLEPLKDKERIRRGKYFRNVGVRCIQAAFRKT